MRFISFPGNYGRAFSSASKELGLIGNTVLMPDTAPIHRAEAIQKMGVCVERMASANLMDGIRKVRLRLTIFRP